MMLSTFLGAYMRFIYHWYSICLNLLPIFDWLLSLLFAAAFASCSELSVYSGHKSFIWYIIFVLQTISPTLFPFSCNPGCILRADSWFWWSPACLCYLFFLFPNKRFSSRILALAVGYILSLSIFIWCEVRVVVPFFLHMDSPLFSILCCKDGPFLNCLAT